MPIFGTLPGRLPNRFSGIVSTPSTTRLSFSDNIPGDLPGSFNDYPSSVDVVSGTGWEIMVRHNTNLGLLSFVPRYESVSFMPSLNDVGSGEIVIDRSDYIFNSATAQGGPGSDILANDHVWEAYYNGKLIFQWLGTTVDMMEVDSGSETQTVTISGPGTGQILQWGKVLSPGFPNVIFKTAALTDQFTTTALNTTLWNTTLSSDITGGWVGSDGQGNAYVKSRALVITGEAPFIGSSAYNALSSYISAKIMPLGQDSQPANLAVNGSFVLGTQGWNADSSALQNSGAVISPTSGDSQDGDNACITITTNATSTHEGIEQQLTNLQARTGYQINGWVKITAGTPTIQLTVKDVTNNITSAPVNVGTATDWTPISIGINTGTTGNVTLLYSFNNGPIANTCQFKLDNVQVYRVDSNCHSQVALTQIASPTQNFVTMELDWGQEFFATVSNAGVQTSVLLGYYDPVAHAYWRIRESSGFFYFDASPDDQTWQQLGAISYNWDASEVEIDFSAWTTTNNSRLNNMVVSALNGGSSQALQQTYVNVPNVGGIFLDLLTQCQKRGTVSVITPTFTETTDSFGVAWGDSISLQIAPGGDLLSQLQASASAVSADWIMRPGFLLDVGLPGSIGTDLSGTGASLAQGKYATASSVRAASSNVAAFAVDGNLGTRWESEWSDPQWLMVDLGAEAQVSQVVITWETASARAYKIQMSDDGINWNDIYSTTSGSGGVETLNISGTGRYIRMYGTARNTIYGYSIWEFQVFGTIGARTVIVHESGQMVSNERLRIRDSISNYIVAGDGAGNLVLQSDASSVATWNQREAYIETSAATSPDTLNEIGAATLAEYKSELSQRTLTIPPDVPGCTPFVDFNIGDWIGVESVELDSIDKVRVIAIAINIDNSENVTVELTLETRIQLFVEQLNNLVQKIASSSNSSSIPAAPGSASQTITNLSTNTSATTYSQLIGDGTSTSYTIPHAFNTRTLTVSVQEANSPWTLLQPVYSSPAANQYTATFPSTSQVTITFSSAPALNNYVVIISA